MEDNQFWDSEHKNTFHYFQEGSEHIGNHPDFQQYKGKLDMVFTSPPYFDREQYSEDEEQSYKSYPQYDDWRDNFLKPTLTSKYESLRNDRYLLWNIKISKSEPTNFIRWNKIVLIFSYHSASITDQTQNVDDLDGWCQSIESQKRVKVNGKYLKYEPIFVFYKKF